MFGKDPEKLFEEVNKKWGEDFDHNKALAGYDNLLLLLESGDYDNLELKNPSDAEHTYDNLTQKAHSYKGQILMIGKKLFQEGMLEFDKAIQINPENQDMVKVKIKALETYRTEREEEDIERRPELSEEVLKCCDKLLSIDNESVAAWLSKSTSYFKLGRYEDVIECDDIILRLYQEKKTATRDPIMKVGSLVSKAICYDLLNRLTESKKCYLEVLELDPYNEKALHFLHDIEMKIAGKKPYSAMNDLERGKKPYSAMNDLKNEEDISTFCENCGKSLKPTTKFCGKCGTPRA